MKTREFCSQVIDYVETSQEAIADLQKEAAEAKASPAFSDDVLEQTAEKLVVSKLLSKEATDSLMQSFREDPDQALLSLQRVVGEFNKRESAPTSLGHTVKIKKNASQERSKDQSPSDKAWEEGFASGA